MFLTLEDLLVYIRSIIVIVIINMIFQGPLLQLLSPFRQMEDLITEKKNSFFELQKTIDECDNAKATTLQAQKELMDTKSILKRRQTELHMLRGKRINYFVDNL